jgi:acyl transferase domain-containing protein
MAYKPVAITGIACRLPGADSPAKLWKILTDGTDPIRETPASRWKIDDYYHAAPGTPGKMYVRRFGFIDGIDQLDSYLFGISPRDAARMDPQHRLMLEVSWEALEHAGVAPSALAGTKTGVFTGISGSEYSFRLTASESSLELMDNRSGIGNSRSLAANRLSYALDLRGPSLVIDTACSSALVAIHLACESLGRGECEIAVAGGVNVLLSPLVTIGFCQSRMLSPDGRSKVFDVAADGYVRSEGCVAIILKRLTDALRAHDRVWGVIRGSAVNHNGRTCGILAPSPQAQAAVIREALRNANASATSIGYIEAHGSGTPIGDLLELQALASVMGPPSGPEDCCWVGSVKANIGHLEAASGIAGVIKVLLCFEHDRIPPQLHLSKVHPQFESVDTRVRVVPDSVAWARSSSSRLAGVSAFGFGGANAHLVLEEPPATPLVRTAAEPVAHLLKLSSKEGESLQRLVERWVEFLETCSAHSLPDVCYTANTGRGDFSYRLAITAGSLRELRAKLSEVCGAPDVFQPVSAKPPKVGFLFGPIDDITQARAQICRAHPAFRRALERLDEACAGTSPLFRFHQAAAECWHALGFTMEAVSGIECGEQSAAAIAKDKALPHRALSESVDCVVTIGKAPIRKNTPNVWLNSVVPGCDAWRTLLDTVGGLYNRGCNMHWSVLDSRPERRKVPVPTYAFTRELHPFPF